MPGSEIEILGLAKDSDLSAKYPFSISLIMSVEIECELNSREQLC
jgi:hypothetical protein